MMINPKIDHHHHQYTAAASSKTSTSMNGRKTRQSHLEPRSMRADLEELHDATFVGENGIIVRIATPQQSLSEFKHGVTNDVAKSYTPSPTMQSQILHTLALYSQSTITPATLSINANQSSIDDLATDVVTEVPLSFHRLVCMSAASPHKVAAVLMNATALVDQLKACEKACEVTPMAVVTSLNNHLKATALLLHACVQYKAIADQMICFDPSQTRNITASAVILLGELIVRKHAASWYPLLVNIGTMLLHLNHVSRALVHTAVAHFLSAAFLCMVDDNKAHLHAFVLAIHTTLRLCKTIDDKRFMLKTFYTTAASADVPLTEHMRLRNRFWRIFKNRHGLPLPASLIAEIIDTHSGFHYIPLSYTYAQEQVAIIVRPSPTEATNIVQLRCVDPCTIANVIDSLMFVRMDTSVFDGDITSLVTHKLQTTFSGEALLVTPAATTKCTIPVLDQFVSAKRMAYIQLSKLIGAWTAMFVPSESSPKQQELGVVVPSSYYYERVTVWFLTACSLDNELMTMVWAVLPPLAQQHIRTAWNNNNYWRYAPNALRRDFVLNHLNAFAGASNDGDAAPLGIPNLYKVLDHAWLMASSNKPFGVCGADTIQSLELIMGPIQDVSLASHRSVFENAHHAMGNHIITSLVKRVCWSTKAAAAAPFFGAAEALGSWIWAGSCSYSHDTMIVAKLRTMIQQQQSKFDYLSYAMWLMTVHKNNAPFCAFSLYGRACTCEINNPTATNASTHALPKHVTTFLKGYGNTIAALLVAMPFELLVKTLATLLHECRGTLAMFLIVENIAANHMKPEHATLHRALSHILTDDAEWWSLIRSFQHHSCRGAVVVQLLGTAFAGRWKNILLTTVPRYDKKLTELRTSLQAAEMLVDLRNDTNTTTATAATTTTSAASRTTPTHTKPVDISWPPTLSRDMFCRFCAFPRTLATVDISCDDTN
jgi:hypothetical protein